ncbi:MAG: flaG [Phenylobacterium sp.]|jgi:flagellar protein FlaG|uniref:flagellar protein FlaG n=1 Tax=Phenylobacterium sp. TaxID=1871053 RepID=UPI0026259E66|nr:flagellar protein FlaG [Phenylobacterium sp.]MDB5462166.1 flaG [Phenylobacterium sp.]MDB5496493.1 flaG [Phenylobacterium sp.]
MDNKVATVAATPDPTFGQKPAAPRPDKGPKADSAAQSQDPVDLRLVIEEDKASGSYIYKTIDRRTGEVVQQLPRDQILKLRDALAYEAGDVVRAKA